LILDSMTPLPSLTLRGHGGTQRTSPAAWQRDAQEAARYPQQQPVVINNYYAPARRGPDADRSSAGSRSAVSSLASCSLSPRSRFALGLTALAMAVMALVLRAIWRDQQGRK
jgi:hypothetical protein